MRLRDPLKPRAARGSLGEGGSEVNVVPGQNDKRLVEVRLEYSIAAGR